jgi:hypothetical protein
MAATSYMWLIKLFSNHFFNARTYETNVSTSASDIFLLNLGIFPRPLEIELKMRSSETASCQEESERSRA